jgi:hypothetical protein
MRKRDRLDIAFVLLVTMAIINIVTMASRQETFRGIVYSVASVRDFVTLTPRDDARLLAGMQTGSRYVLVDRDGVYPLQGAQDRVGAFNGHEATIMGSFADGKIHVSTLYRSRVAETASH